MGQVGARVGRGRGRYPRFLLRQGFPYLELTPFPNYVEAGQGGFPHHGVGRLISYPVYPMLCLSFTGTFSLQYQGTLLTTFLLNLTHPL